MSTRNISVAVVVALASMAAGCGGGGGYGGGGSGSGDPPPNGSNKAPTISGLVTSQSIAQDELSDLLAFTIADADSPATDISLTVSSSSAVIDQDGLQIGGNGANRMLVIAPAEGASGNAIVTVTATDPSGASSTAKVNVTVSSGQRTFTEVVGTALLKSFDDEAERVSGYSLVDDTNEDPNVFDYLVE